jgi:hypothetical protein
MSIILIAPYGDGRNVTSDAFVRPLRAAVGNGILEVNSDRGLWKSAQVQFMDRNADYHRDAEEPSEAFEKDIQDTFAFVADWIDERRNELLEMRRSGLKLILLFDFVIDQDQFELNVPPALMRAAGAAEVPIKMISND